MPALAASCLCCSCPVRQISFSLPLSQFFFGEVESTAVKNLLSSAICIEITSLKRKGKSRERKKTNGGEESGDLRALRLKFLGSVVIVTNHSAPANR